MIAYLRAESGQPLQLVVAPLDGSGTGIALGPRAPFGSDGPTINNYSWSPDGTAILANYDADKKASRSCPSTGLPRASSPTVRLALPAYQRLATLIGRVAAGRPQDGRPTASPSPRYNRAIWPTRSP